MFINTRCFAVSDYEGNRSWQFDPHVRTRAERVSLRPVAVHALLVGLVVAEVDDLLVGVHGEVAILHGAGRVDRLVRTAGHVTVVEQAAVELNTTNKR